jgi:hypothetical protein
VDGALVELTRNEFDLLAAPRRRARTRVGTARARDTLGLIDTVPPARCQVCHRSRAVIKSSAVGQRTTSGSAKAGAANKYTP